MAEKVDLGVIGAGFSGLAVARTYLELHPLASVVVFDSADTVGGVWAKHRLYPGLKSNNMLGTYEYPDFPIDEELQRVFGVKPGDHVSGEIIHEYLTRFAKKFGVFQRVRFNTKVEAVEQVKGEGWLLHVQSVTGPEKVMAEKLVIATGITSEPFMPVMEGANTFGAPLFHIKDFRQHADLLQTAKNVVVLGGTKSAFDAAYAFADAGVHVDMVIRESGHGPMWMCPPYVTPLKKWLEKLTTTRLLTWFSPCIWGDADGYSSVRRFMHGTAIGRWIVDTFWGILGNDVLTLNAYDKHPETALLKPWSNPMFMGSGISILNYEHNVFDYFKNGLIKVHIADIVSLSDHNVHLSNGDQIQTDAMVCSTGWKHRPPIKFVPNAELQDTELGLPHYAQGQTPLEEKADREILTKFPRLKAPPLPNPKLKDPTTDPNDVYAPTKLNQPYRLYRFMIPPALIEERNLAFAGFSANFVIAMQAQIQALWLCAYFDGKLDINKSTVEYDTVLHSQFGKWRYPSGHGAEYPDFVFDAIPYLDLLLAQLGLKTHRKGGSFAEFLEPYGPEDYRGLIDEWKEVEASRAGMNGKA